MSIWGCRLAPILATIAATAVLFLQAGICAADEGTLTLPAGGLVFAQDPAIEFEKEQVQISARKVTVRHTLRNTADSDRGILVAAPLPDLDMADRAQNGVRLAASTYVNFVNLQVMVDGKKVDPNWEQRAIAARLDVTDTLLDADLPMGPDLSEMAERIADLKPEARAQLTERGILQIEDAQLHPAWVLKTTFFWRQVIKAGSSAVIEISYQPVTGKQSYSPATLDRLKSTFCIGDAAAKTVAERAMRGGGPPDMVQLGYQLMGGAHWSKPTKRFQLIIEKDDPTVVLASCRSGLVPVSNTRMEWSAENFLPSEDIAVLFVR